MVDIDLTNLQRSSPLQQKEEYDRLVVENAQLKVQCQRLQDTIAQYISRFGTLVISEELSFIHSRTHRHDIADLPPEILLLIFKRSVAPAFLISPSYSVYEESWMECMRTKQTLSLVCRLWQQVAIELLYEDIGFRSIGQLAALLETLTTKPQLAHLVRSLTVACHIAPHTASVYIGDLLSILRMCQRLHTISFRVHGVSQNHVSPLPVRPTTPFAHVVNLHFAEAPSSLQDLLPILTNMSPRLQSLRIVLANSDTTPVPKLIFQAMTTFILTTPWINQSSIRDVAKKWIMPCVENVTFSLSVYLPIPSPPPTMVILEDAFQTFANRNGSRIRYLQLHAAYCVYTGAGMKYSVDIQPMLRHCPLLEHLVLPANMRHPISHPTLKWIDVWEPHQLSCRDIWTEVDNLTKVVFPRLRGVRTIDCALSLMMDLPRVIHPDVCAGLGAAVAAFEYPGIKVKVTEARLWRADMEHWHADDNADDWHRSDDEAQQEVKWDEKRDERDRIETEEDDFIDDLDYEPGPSYPTTPVSSASSSVSSCAETVDDSEDTEQIPVQWTHDDVLQAFRNRDVMPYSGRFSLG
ncbi:hypothetical protein BD626DRAFT_627263 [Schizophyllum amplum]|uniref:Uncharacterized protein n=1 Tax=Schizophyllum amplum TaxID=97359 RepID=A0A550CPS3_9AGAR|nr:hypothetical protein BD626DRAFT_627263 [Auriculariopsis ampla]